MDDLQDLAHVLRCAERDGKACHARLVAAGYVEAEFEGSFVAGYLKGTIERAVTTLETHIRNAQRDALEDLPA